MLKCFCQFLAVVASTAAVVAVVVAVAGDVNTVLLLKKVFSLSS